MPRILFANRRRGTRPHGLASTQLHGGAQGEIAGLPKLVDVTRSIIDQRRFLLYRQSRGRKLTATDDLGGATEDGTLRLLPARKVRHCAARDRRTIPSWRSCGDRILSSAAWRPDARDRAQSDREDLLWAIAPMKCGIMWLSTIPAMCVEANSCR